MAEEINLPESWSRGQMARSMGLP